MLQPPSRSLTKHLDAHAGDVAARLMAVRLLADVGRADDAAKLFSELDEDAQAQPEAITLKRRLEHLASGTDVADLERRVVAQPDDLALRVELGRILTALGRSGDGLEHLLHAVECDRKFDDESARKSMIEVFEALGEDSPVVNEYRRRLQMVLF